MTKSYILDLNGITRPSLNLLVGIRDRVPRLLRSILLMPSSSCAGDMNDRIFIRASAIRLLVLARGINKLA
jgi:hypothetical protein